MFDNSGTYIIKDFMGNGELIGSGIASNLSSGFQLISSKNQAHTTSLFNLFYKKSKKSNIYIFYCPEIRVICFSA